MDQPFENTFQDETTESLLEQSQQNAQSMILATIAVLDDLGLLPEAWADAVAERFSYAWGIEEPWEPAEFLDAMLTNYRALGATVEEVTSNNDVATAIISGFPDDELSDLFTVAIEDSANFHRIAAGIARPRSLDWTWELLDENRTRFSVIRRVD